MSAVVEPKGVAGKALLAATDIVQEYEQPGGGTETTTERPSGK